METAVAPIKRSRDEASRVLGEKMLQGWTMLGASCPVEDCYTPLLRNKQGKMLCARCDQFVISEEEAIKQAEQKAEEDSRVVKKEAANEPYQEEERRHRIEQRFHLEEQARQAKQMLTLEQAHNHQAINLKVKRKNVTTLSPNSDVEVNTIRRQTLAALYEKMVVLTDALSPNDHCERLISVSKALREIAEAAHLLKE
ncbi:Zn-ribbon-containing protein implicated in mitosis [Plasmopara halstedii]|uniref:Zn-ribbon-containing protein implicated in mitosis n=1 Tax=Plasmopara halstedii TaxID=4781 RepID=A0A0P1B3U7_PLAHL|nr:Zn-ribbon-containing protein implicated in mitosis [Plasmopara halstedii]CEG49418.1 Zn-ribbon-containing protein implicated in mitosis [Plasmopara halstedii]|eukprot:XP_024585787.1 Zn-ribbon-containing protein implicated in mitosis [Plasmopara halstedii]